jgi:saccharopine dehydrogenase-like NADP-dependent oxidoreductase
MKIGIIGCGNQGLGFAARMMKRDTVTEIRLLESKESAMKRGIELLGSINENKKNIEAEYVDASSEDDVAHAIKECNVVLNATMPEFNISIMKGCRKAGVNYIDLYAYPNGAPHVEKNTTVEGQKELDRDFTNAGIVAVPSVGVNPGWVTLMANIELCKMDSVEDIVIRELEWIDSDEIFCSGPPELLLEMFLGDPGPQKIKDGEPLRLDFVRDYDTYEYPAPVGIQKILPSSDNGTSLQIIEDSPIPVMNIAENFSVLSGGLSMKDIILTALERQTRKTNKTDDILGLISKSFTPTNSVNFKEAKKEGRIRDAAWISAIELTGVKDGGKVKISDVCMATLDTTLEEIPWATPGVLATTAMPVEVADMILSGEIIEKGVVPVTQLSMREEVVKRISQSQIIIKHEEKNVVQS